jgi:4-aminobutyrate aminotransferase-like enzyme
MSPSAVTELAHQEDQISCKVLPNGFTHTAKLASISGAKRTMFLLDRHLRKDFPIVVAGKGNLLFTKDGRTIFDTTSGAAVSCLGHGNERVISAVHSQMSTGIPYLASTFWASEVVDELCEELIIGTDRKMAKVYLTGSGLWLSSYTHWNRAHIRRF